MKYKKVKAVNFYHKDGRFLGVAAIGAAANRFEASLKTKYGKSILRKEI